jgi:hypothetical protein
MSNLIKLYYAKLPNMGDLLNVLLMENYFNLRIKRATPLNCDMSAIGSGLGNFMVSNKLPLKTAQLVSAAISGNVEVWGTGFISKATADNSFFRKKMNFHAVRGELSKRRVESILGHKIEAVTADAGLLADLLVSPMKEKKYALGIIPHFREQTEPVFAELKDKFSNSTIIDLMEDPISVIKKIASCEAIISSSLHGLIVADSYGIPNRWIVVSDKPKGDGFKYHDYYSAYGIDIEPLDHRNASTISINQIVDYYRIEPKMVNEKKALLIDCFPFKQ